MQCLIERASVGIKTQLTSRSHRFAHPCWGPHEILISDATRVTICYTVIDPAGGAVRNADEAMDGCDGLRRTESGASFIRDEGGNSELNPAFCPRIACHRCLLVLNQMRSWRSV